MTRTIETPEKKSTQYDMVWVDAKIDILLGLVAARLPQLGIYLASLLNKNKDALRQIIIKYYTEMHAYTFSQIKNVVRNTMTPQDHDFSKDAIKSIVVDLEKEYGAAIPELGIESDTVIDAFVANQCRWFSANFRFKETA